MASKEDTTLKEIILDFYNNEKMLVIYLAGTKYNMDQRTTSFYYSLNCRTIGMMNFILI